MITKTCCLLNSKYQYKSATQEKLNSSIVAWYIKKYFKIITNFATVLFSTFTYAQSDTLHYPEEKHFKNIQQLTFGGDNAEAYWSYDDKHVIFQRTNPKDGIMCDRIFLGAIPQQGQTFSFKQVSSGKGRTTCGYFLPDEKQITNTKGYDAEGTLSTDGKKMIFTSVRNGDLDLYIMDLKTYKVKQITNTLGYDGGAWFSPDGKKIVWRASRPKTDSAIKEYKDLMAQGIVAPTQMEVFIANADGTDAKQITNLGQANWAPNFTPDGKHIIFCSNHEYKRGFPFNMYLINLDGTGLEKISRDKGFDAFPMFSHDGKKIMFSSNRNNGGGHDTNVFIADWIE